MEAATVTGEHLRTARLDRGWTQKQTGARLGLSQSYLSMLERSERPVPQALLPTLFRTYEFPATALPFRGLAAPLTAQQLAEAVAATGYPGFRYLTPHVRLNPAELLVNALHQSDLESRLAEALPWLVLTHPELDWHWLLHNIRLRDLQNRLGFVVTLARELAQRRGESENAASLAHWEASLERSRLARQDTFCHDSITEAERTWLRKMRPRAARHWNLLTDLTSDQLTHVWHTAP